MDKAKGEEEEEEEEEKHKDKEEKGKGKESSYENKDYKDNNYYHHYSYARVYACCFDNTYQECCQHRFQVAFKGVKTF